MVTFFDLENLIVLVRVIVQLASNWTVPFFLTALSKTFCVQVVMVVTPPEAHAGVTPVPIPTRARHTAPAATAPVLRT
jgi:hypothetical protein